MEILVRVLHNEWVSLESERDTDIVAPRDIAVLDPPAQAILSCCSVDVWTAACIALEVRRQWDRFGTGDDVPVVAWTTRFDLLH